MGRIQGEGLSEPGFARLQPYDFDNEPSLDGFTFRQAQAMAARCGFEDQVAVDVWVQLATISTQRNSGDTPVEEPGGPLMLAPAVPVSRIEDRSGKGDQYGHLKSNWVLADETYRITQMLLETLDDSDDMPPNLRLLTALLNERIGVVREQGSALPVWRKNIPHYN